MSNSKEMIVYDEAGFWKQLKGSGSILML